MKKTTKKNTNVNWEKVAVYGIALGWAVSMLYLMLVLTANVTM